MRHKSAESLNLLTRKVPLEETAGVDTEADSEYVTYTKCAPDHLPPNLHATRKTLLKGLNLLLLGAYMKAPTCLVNVA